MVLEIISKNEFDFVSISELTPYSPFSQIETIKACMEVFEYEYFFAVLKESDKIVAAMPLVKIDDSYMPAGYFGDQDVFDFNPISFKSIVNGIELIKELLKWAQDTNQKLLLREIPNELASAVSAKKELDAIIPICNIDLNSHAQENKPIYKKKHRKEMRRKFNRLESEAIKLRIEYAVEKTAEVKSKFFEFFSKSSNDEKQKFIQTKAVEYFSKFLDLEEIKLSTLFFNDKLVSILVYFENDSKWAIDRSGRKVIYLYNMASDTQYYDYSPGLIHVNSMIMDVIQKRYAEFNFLRGAERYKFEIGANGCKWNQFIKNF
jgi:hypothetical protein